MKAMLPLISANDNWNVRKQHSRSNALATLSAYTSTMYTGFAPFDRTGSPWKHHIPNRDSASARQPESSDDEEAKRSTKQFADPTTVSAAKSFRSSTMLRQVPIMRRHLDTFGGRVFSIPMKTKPVPVHTGRFIYDPQCPPLYAAKLSQNERLQAEIEMIQRVRGQKRKREALEHRWGRRNFDLAGIEVTRAERYSIQAEVQKLKELILPTAAREIYTGRGIRLPSTHQTVNPNKPRPATEGPKPPPPTTNRRNLNFPSLRGTAARGATHASNRTSSHWEAAARLQMDHQSRPSTKLQIQSIPAPGIAPAPTPIRPDTVETPMELPPPPPSQPLQSEPPESVLEAPTPLEYPQTPKMHEPVETIEVIDPDVEDEERAKSAMVIPETPIERPRSLAAPSVSPETSAPKPILPISESTAEPLVSQSVQDMLREQFRELEKKGPIKIDDILSLAAEDLTDNQRRYLKCLHEVSSHGTPLVFNELIAYTCLAKIIQGLSPSTLEMYEQCNFQILPETVVQYTELFNSVDRTSRGQIGIASLTEILKTTLQRQFTDDDKLLAQIFETIDKDKDAEMSKIEFLAYIPYFMYLEDMA